MKFKRNQQGITLSGLIMGCVVLGTFALLLMKLWPLYNEKIKVDQAMDKLAADADGARMTKTAMVKAMMRQFDVSDVDSFDTPRLMKTLQVGRKKGSKNKVVSMVYEIRGPLVGDLDIVLKYNRSIEFGPPKTD